LHPISRPDPFFHLQIVCISLIASDHPPISFANHQRANYQEDRMSRSPQSLSLIRPQDPDSMRTAITLLVDKGISFTRRSEWQLKIGKCNYWPHKRKAHRDGDLKALVDIDPPKFLLLLDRNLAPPQPRPHMAVKHPQPAIPSKGIIDWHKTLTTSPPHGALPRPLDVVRELIRNDVQVFPVNPSTKKPLTGADRTAPNRWGATADATITLNRFMRLFPTAMIGVPTGLGNGLFACSSPLTRIAG